MFELTLANYSGLRRVSCVRITAQACVFCVLPPGITRSLMENVSAWFAARASTELARIMLLQSSTEAVSLRLQF